MNCPATDIDFYSDAVIKNPYPVYATLRNLGPLVYLKKNDLYVVARYKEVSEVLLQPLRFVSSRGVSPIAKVNDILVGSTLNSDPPEHDKTRAVTAEPLLPGALFEYEPRLKAAADGLINTLCERGSFDAVADLAQYLPITIVAELVGLPEAVDHKQMLTWASAAFNLFGTENARTVKAFEDLKNLRDFLQEYGRPEKLKEGGWAKRIFDVGGERGISYETCTQLMRDYINPSLDTTISTTAQLVKFFSDNPEQWQAIRNDGSLIPNAVEEAVRMATPIRAFTRYAIEDIDVAGYTIPKGKRVIVVYASANRDPEKYPNPDKFDVTRDVHDHVGFGQGVHMCMGMHLARREMILLLEALRKRVERFELLETPEVAMNNTIRAYSRMPVKLHLSNDILPNTIKPASINNPWLEVTIATRSVAADKIISLELEPTNGSVLPSYEAGAHIDVYIQSGLIRQYSLTGDPGDSSRYRLGILLDEHSKGGSETIHQNFQTGRNIRIGRPRNHFPLQENVLHSVLVAGGVGITPILSMAYALDAKNASWELHYCGRNENRMAFLSEAAQFGDKFFVHLSSGPDSQRFDITSVLHKPSKKKHLYVCGPVGFMEFVVNSAKQLEWETDCIHLERFGAEIDTNGEPFTVVAKKSGKTFDVLPGETINEKLAHNGIDVPVSCQSGVCGTCLTAVLDGMPDHRDLVQTDIEKATNNNITVCCSRSKTKRLVLDV